MTPPLGAAPGSDLANIQSGIGNVHNLYFLDKYEKTVFHGPLTNFPKPIWFPSHQPAEKIAWKLVLFYCNPALVGLPGLLVPAMLEQTGTGSERGLFFAIDYERHSSWPEENHQ